MSTVLEPPEIESPPDRGGGNDIFDPGPPGGGDPWDARFPPRYDPYRAAVWVFVVPVLVFFGGLTHTMLAYRGASANWVVLRLPHIMYANTAALLCSSLALELGRRAMRKSSRRLQCWLHLTTVLGFLFLAGQLYAWKELARSGIAVESNAGLAFFYVMTASHAVHLTGALVALTYLTVRQSRGEFTPRRQSALNATAVFWHFMGGLWLCILVLLCL